MKPKFAYAFTLTLVFVFCVSSYFSSYFAISKRKTIFNSKKYIFYEKKNLPSYTCKYSELRNNNKIQKLITDIIDKNQFPINCTNRKYWLIRYSELVAVANGFSFTNTMRLLSSTLLYAVLSNFTVIYYRDKSNVLPNEWVYYINNSNNNNNNITNIMTCTDNNYGMDCYFKSITNCTVNDITNINNIPNYRKRLTPFPGNHIVYNRLHKKILEYINNNNNSDINFTETDFNLHMYEYNKLHRFKKENHKNFIINYILYIVNSFILRYNKKLDYVINDIINKTISQISNFNPLQTCVIPIRRSDKCHNYDIKVHGIVEKKPMSEMDCNNIQELLVIIQWLHKYDNISNVIITSEDSNVFETVNRLKRNNVLLLHNINILYNIFDNVGNGNSGLPQFWNKKQRQLNGDIKLIKILSTLELLNLNKYYINNYGSTWQRWIFTRAYYFGCSINKLHSIPIQLYSLDTEIYPNITFGYRTIYFNNYVKNNILNNFTFNEKWIYNLYKCNNVTNYCILNEYYNYTIIEKHMKMSNQNIVEPSQYYWELKYSSIFYQNNSNMK